ncbi:hypothetical protein ABH15_10290 [Methanoculleus taiwanensis]|uniref:FIST domain containing protein n=1 Tax=Methanoculleus taiwanensis TaxID=1550565 RepID=A0A498H3A5_9EURY|nr:FIST N-terminal domain-containing protein [Methanoculleus taiwanensis]RXE56456.1 hypothetical protein ABH15_10290 [Methanoculleus taiwanensis]
MNAITLSTTKPSVNDAVNDLKEQCGDFKPKMLLFFASSGYEPGSLAGAMKDAFGDLPVFGCTTAGEIGNGSLLKGSIVAMALNDRIIEDLKVGVVRDLSNPEGIRTVFSEFESYYGQPMTELDFTKYVGIILIDGLSGAEERTMDRIGDLTNLLFVGGSAGDDLRFASTYVFADGKAYTNAAVLALLKPATEFDLIKTQSFIAMDTTLLPTKVNEEAREVLEFNGKPASVAYAEALGVSPDDLAAHFMQHPVGLLAGDDIFVRSPRQVSGESVFFYCNVKEGVDLAVLESTDIVADTRAAVQEKLQKLGGISALINFNCILRTLDLEDRGLSAAYGSLFSDIPAIGFSTYGEEYIGHINQTATMLVFH